MIILILDISVTLLRYDANGLFLAAPITVA